VENIGAIENHKLMDGKLTLYQRRDCKVWWCGFYYKRQHIRASTKTHEIAKAKEAARKWYIARQYEIENGVQPVGNPKSFGVAADKAIQRYEEQGQRKDRSESYVKSVRNLILKLKTLAGRASVEQAAKQMFWEQLSVTLAETGIKSTTIHQYKNALMIVLKLAYRRGELEQLPRLLSDKTGKHIDTPRTYFDGKQYSALFNQLHKHIAWHRKHKTRWIEAAEELKDYVQFVAGSGMRVGEALNVRFKDITVTQQKDPVTKELKSCLVISNIKGKRSRSHVTRTYYTSYVAFMRCVQRHGLGEEWRKSDAAIFKHYHRDSFRQVLEDAKLRYTDDNPPRKRDLMSLRHTYICFALERGVPTADIAANCRTSTAMIDKHYAKWRNVANNENLNRNFTLNIDAD